MNRALDQQVILLTGATGLLGSRFLKEILGRQDLSKVYVLLRDQTLAQGWSRLLSRLKVFSQHLELQHLQSQIEILLGDVTLKDWGLPSEDFDRVVKTVHHIFHMAADTDLLSSQLKSEKMNLVSTEEGLKIFDKALHFQGRCFHYISSFSIVGDQIFSRRRRFSENDFDIGQGFRLMPYQRSKFLAEKAVRHFGSPHWKIYRPGQIFGDSGSGAYPEPLINKSIFHDLIKSCLSLGCVPNSRWLFDVTPVDKVAKGIAELGLNREANQETYHLLDPCPPTLIELKELLSRISKANLSALPVGDFLEQAKRLGRRSLFPKALETWTKRLNEQFTDRISIDCSQTQSLLSFPLLNDHEKLLAKYEFLFEPIQKSNFSFAEI